MELNNQPLDGWGLPSIMGHWKNYQNPMMEGKPQPSSGWLFNSIANKDVYKRQAQHIPLAGREQDVLVHGVVHLVDGGLALLHHIDGPEARRAVLFHEQRVEHKGIPAVVVDCLLYTSGAKSAGSSGGSGSGSVLSAGGSTIVPYSAARLYRQGRSDTAIRSELLKEGYSNDEDVYKRPV